MKKIFSFFCYIAIAIAAVTFVSCGNDEEDDIITPKPEQEAKIPVYIVEIGDGALELLDIKLNIYRNGKKQEVVLDKNKVTPLESQNKYLNGYYCSSVNGEEGVDSVVAEVSLKSNLKDILASKNPEEVSNFYVNGHLKEVNKVANGNYLAYCDVTQGQMSSWKVVSSESVSNGEIYYERLCRTTKERLSKK